MRSLALTRVARDAGRVAAACAALLALACPDLSAAADAARLAVDQGCLNCHSAQSHSAPTLQRLSERLARDGDRPEALQHALEEMREKASIHTHQMVSDDSALAVLRWLAEGAK